MPWKAFLRLFIALSVTSVCRLQNLNRAECVKVKPDNKFPFNFLPESLKRYEPAWKNAVHTITNFTNGCLQKHFLNQSKHPCEKPVITIAFPLISDNPRIPLQVLPRPYLATKKDSSCTDNQVLCALGQIWKLFVFCLMAAAISGIIIWFLDHKINSGHFPKSFWSGSREGLWWAIVTMTTVGYGDRTPKSLLGRVYASLWMIVGMLLMSCITAQISSTMTTDDLRPLDDKFGQNIGVPHGSKKFFEPLCHGAKLKENSTEASLLSSLQDGKVDKIYLFDCKENEETRDLKIVHVLYTQPVIGAEVQLVGEMNNRKVKITFNKCLKQWADEYEDDDVYLERVARKMLKEEGWESKIPEDEEEQRHCIERHRLGRYRHDDELTATQLGLIDILLCTVAGLLITLLTTGAVWDTCLKLRHKKKSLDNNADIEKAAGTQELQSTTTILN